MGGDSGLQTPSPCRSCCRLTAFVLKSFAQARSFIFIDLRELAVTKGWIIRQQRADGSFPAVGRILNKDIQVSDLPGTLVPWPFLACPSVLPGACAVGVVPPGSG